MLDNPPASEPKPPAETPPSRHEPHSASQPNEPGDRERPEKTATPCDDHTDAPGEKKVADSKDCKDQNADAADGDVAATGASEVAAETTPVVGETPDGQPVAATLPAPTAPLTPTVPDQTAEAADIAAFGAQALAGAKTASAPKTGAVAVVDLKSALKDAGDKSGDDAAPAAAATPSITPDGETRTSALKQLATAVEGHSATQTELHALLAAGPRLGRPTSEADSAASGSTKPGADATQNLSFVLPNHQNTVATPSSPPPAAAVPLADLAVAIAHGAQAGKNRFEIRLDPPELGRIDVRLDIDRDGNVSSRLVVERQDTLDLLRRDATQLERALQQAGLKTADNALEFSLRGQAFGRNPETPQHVAQLTATEDNAVPLEQWNGYGRLLGLGSGVDIRV